MGDVAEIDPPHVATVLAPLSGLDVMVGHQVLEEAFRKAASRHPLETDQDVSHALHEAAMGRGLIIDIEHPPGELVARALLELKRDRDGERVLMVRYLVGDDLDAWLPDFLEYLHAMARREGCSSIGLVGRWGWIKELAPHGWRTRTVAMTCEVEADG